MTTGLIFGLVTVAHVWRMADEAPSLIRDPWYLLLTILSGTLAVWAWRLLHRSRRSN